MAKPNTSEWYNEEIRPLLEIVKTKAKERNKNIEYVFIIAEPNEEVTEFYCCSEFDAARSVLVSDIAKTLDAVLAKNSKKTLN